jgi:hypothetical protein
MWLPGKRNSKQEPSLLDSYTLASPPASRKQIVNLKWNFVLATIPPFPPSILSTHSSLSYTSHLLRASSHISDPKSTLGASRILESQSVWAFFKQLSASNNILNDLIQPLISSPAFFTTFPPSDTDCLSIRSHDKTTSAPLGVQLL